MIGRNEGMRLAAAVEDLLRYAVHDPLVGDRVLISRQRTELLSQALRGYRSTMRGAGTTGEPGEEPRGFDELVAGLAHEAHISWANTWSYDRWWGADMIAFLVRAGKLRDREWEAWLTAGAKPDERPSAAKRVFEGKEPV